MNLRVSKSGYVLSILLIISILPMMVNAQTNEGTQDVSWSPDGSQLATANLDGQVYIWDQTGQLHMTLADHQYGVNAVAWSPAGDLIASGGNDRLIKIWDAVEGILVTTLTGHQESGVIQLAWRPDSSQLASIALNELFIWDTTTWEMITSLKLATVTNAQWSPDGSKLAVSGYSIQLIVLDGETFEGQTSLSGHDGPVFDVAWNSDGSMLVSTSQDGTIRLWDMNTASEIGILVSVDEPVWEIVFSPDDHYIAGAINNGIAQVWNTETGVAIETITQDGQMRSVAWNPNDHLLALGWVASSVEFGSQVQTNVLVESRDMFQIIPIRGGSTREE